jgi:toxin ParE1/3/4
MRVAWLRPALRDLDQIQDFIANESPAAAFKLTSELIGRTEKMLGANPKIGRKGRAHGTRELVMSGTPYIVVYRVRQIVEILAVVHGAREWPDSFN